MTPWIPINADSLQAEERQEIAGVEIVVGLSPYDIPSHFRAYYDPILKRFVIGFKYLSEDEERLTQTQNDHISLVVGKESGSLYEVQLKVDDLKAFSVSLRVGLPEVDSTLHSLANKMHSRNKSRHYEAVREVIKDNRAELLAAT